MCSALTQWALKELMGARVKFIVEMTHLLVVVRSYSCSFRTPI